MFSLLGPNGAGKTTTVEVLEGFRHRDGGEVSVLGADPHAAPRHWRDRIGIVLQTSGGLDLLTPREALRSTARAYRAPRDVDEVLEATASPPRPTSASRVSPEASAAASTSRSASSAGPSCSSSTSRRPGSTLRPGATSGS